jgi:hypothetical protein
LEDEFYNQAKTIETLKSELINANETIIMQQSEKEALKEIIRAQDSFKRELEQVLEEQQEKQMRIDQYENKIRILNETLEALKKEDQEVPMEEHKSPSDDETQLAEPLQLERSQSDIVRHFDFSVEDMQDFLTAPPVRFSFDSPYQFEEGGLFSHDSSPVKMNETPIQSDINKVEDLSEPSEVQLVSDSDNAEFLA